MPKCLRTEDDLRQVGMCKGLHGLAPIPVNELQRPTRCTRYYGTDTFTVMSSHIDSVKFSFLLRTVTDWNALTPSAGANQSSLLILQ